MTRDLYRIATTPIGWIGLIWSDAGLKRSTLPLSTYFQAVCDLKLDGKYDEAGENDPYFMNISGYLEDYVSGINPNRKPVLDIVCTDFQTAVWRVTASISYGTTQSYSWVAGRIGKPNSFRAVGQALKANPVPIFVPCHRVISSSKGLGGYVGTSAIDTKHKLLQLEGYI